jgi:glycine/D-amino acid oxidase-like deaminating enzyme
MDAVDGYINAAGAFRTGIVASPLTGELVAQIIAGEPTSIDPRPYLAARFHDADQSASSRPIAVVAP